VDQGTEKREPSAEQPNMICVALLELIPAYSIGATDPAEERFIKANLEHCPEAVAELARYMELSEVMLSSPPLVQAPADLGDKLLAAITVPQPVKAPRQNPLRKRLSFPRWNPGRLAAAILVILVIGSNVYLGTQIIGIRSRQQEIDARLDAQNKALLMLSSGAASRFELAANTAAEPMAPYAAIVWDPNADTAVLTVKHFPALPSDKAYQLWLNRGGKRESGGVFQVNDYGIGTLVFRASGPINTFDSMGITPEPATGSPGPTAPPVVRYVRQ
jgi:hypothetical protein